nr:unnamed protein product [Naegleria fowleri]
MSRSSGVSSSGRDDSSSSSSSTTTPPTTTLILYDHNQQPPVELIEITLHQGLHNLRNNPFQVRSLIGGTLQLMQAYASVCLCQSCGESSNLSNTTHMHTNVVNDCFINPELRPVELVLQNASDNFCSVKRDGQSLSITLEKYGKNPGKNLKFIVLPFRLDLGDQVKEFYVTIRILKSNETQSHNKRAFTNVNACYISPLYDQSQFIAMLRQNSGSLRSSTTQASHPYRTNISTLPVIPVLQNNSTSVSLLGSAGGSSASSSSSSSQQQQTIATPQMSQPTEMVIYDSPSNQVPGIVDKDELVELFKLIPEDVDFSDLRVSAIHFTHGFKHNRDPNNIYLELQNNRTGTIQLWPKIVNIQVLFVPRVAYATIDPVLVTGTLALSDNMHAMVLIITPDVHCEIPGNIECDVHVIINESVIDSNATYTYVDNSPNVAFLASPLVYYQGNVQQQGSNSSEFNAGSYQAPQTPGIGTVMGIMNILQSFVQVLTSVEESNYQAIIQNFLKRHTKTRDLLGFNLAGHLKLRNCDSLVNVLKQNGIEPIIPVWANASLNLSIPTTATTSVSNIESSSHVTQSSQMDEEKAEVRTNNIVETMKTRISEMQQVASSFDDMVERTYQKVKHATSINRLQTQHPSSSSSGNETPVLTLTQNLCNSLIPTSNLASVLDISKRHMDAKKSPYLKVKFIAYDQNASENTPQATPNLKAALFIAKYIIEFDPETQLITSTDHEQKSNFHYQTFYNQDVALFRQNEEIESFLKKLSDFNCSWNANMLYDDVKTNSAHYCMSFLKYANVWNADMPYAKFLTNLCERKPLYPMFLMHQDFFFMDSVPISKFLESQEALTWHWAQSAKDHMKNSSDSPFFQYDFNNDNTIVNAQDPKKRLFESMIAFTKFFTTCAVNFLKTDEGTKFLRFLKYLLVTNLSELPQDLSLEPVTQKFNLTFQRQLYNIVWYLQYIKPNAQSEKMKERIEHLVKKWEGLYV